jgi:hypothetical protein
MFEIEIRYKKGGTLQGVPEWECPFKEEQWHWRSLMHIDCHAYSGIIIF